MALLAVTAWGAGGAAEPRLLGKWSFEPPSAQANAVAGGPAAVIEGATASEGREGKGLAFEDWSVKNYLKPDPRQATRVVITDGADGRLNPPLPFRISAWIHPTADPIYYGGIVEKGRGLGSSYRLLLLRGLKVQASVGERHIVVRSPSPLSLNAWHQVGLRAGGGTLSLWVDGQQVASAPLPPDVKLTSGDPIVVGDRFSGRIDEVELSAE